MNSNLVLSLLLVLVFFASCTKVPKIKSDKNRTLLANQKNDRKSANSNKSNVFRLFKDFDEISLKGIDEISDFEKSLPYVALHYNKDNTLKYYKAYHANNKIYERHYKKRLGVLSTYHTSPMSRGVRSHNFTFFTTENEHLIFSYEGNPYQTKDAILLNISLVQKTDERTLIKKLYYVFKENYGTPKTLKIEELPIEEIQQPDVVYTILSSKEQECHTEEHFSDGESTFVSDEPYCFNIAKSSSFWVHLSRYEKVDRYQKD